MTLLTYLFIIVFLAGLYFYAKCADPKYLEGLTNNNCMNTNCCILANGKKCMAGNKEGPIFFSDKMNNKINIDYYYYKQKCIGKC